MEINMKDKLRTLRKKKNVTQEVLANHLGITPQSVGKWERGEGFPDITLLPKLAFYFDVTVDELLNVGRGRVEEAIKEYERQSSIYRRSGENEKNLELWEKAYREFPNDCRVIENLMYAINRREQWPCPINEATRIIALGQELLQRSTDTRQRESAIQCLCFTYNSIGNQEKALYYADMGGSIYCTREELRATVLNGEKGIKAKQDYIMQLIRDAALTASSIGAQANSHAEVIAAYQFAIDLIKLLFSDDNVGFFAHDLSYYCCCIAQEYAHMRDMTNTLEALEKSVKYAVMAATLTDMQYSAPMVNRLQHNKSDVSKNYDGNSCNLRLKDMKYQCFDFIRNEERTNKIITNLKKYAE